MNATTKCEADSTPASQHFCANPGFSASTANWQPPTANSYLYDSWNLVGSSEISNFQSQIQTNNSWFVWGLDLSGSLQGAGGVGGLLAILSPDSCLLSPVFDANGNVSEMLSALSSELSILAHYEYSPFGETIVATGELAKENPYRFSTKYTDDETKLVYYGYRYFSPDLGRWLSNDPLMDPGSPVVMGIKERVLKLSDRYLLAQISLMLDKSLTDEERLSVLHRAYIISRLSMSIIGNEPDLCLSLAGNNWLLFCSNNPAIFIDPFGLDNLRPDECLGIVNNMPPYGIDAFGNVTGGGQIDAMIDAFLVSSGAVIGGAGLYYVAPVVVAGAPQIYNSIQNAYYEVSSQIASSQPFHRVVNDFMSTAVWGGNSVGYVNTVISTPNVGEMVYSYGPAVVNFSFGFANTPPENPAQGGGTLVNYIFESLED